MRLGIITSLLIFTVSSFAQPKNDEIIPKVIPPSPNAAAIEKFNTIPVDYSTGIPSISYPIWSWNRNKLNFNIGLSYHAGGVKVDDIASNVGLGWTLTGAGRISRTVKGIPDDSFNGYANTPELPQIETYANLNEDYLLTSPFPSIRTNVFTTIGITDMNSIHSTLIMEINKNIYDGEQDVFSINCNSLKGSFVFDKDREVIFLEESNFKVDVVWGDFYPQSSSKRPIEKFIVTDDDGIMYYFEKKEIQSATSYPIQFPPIAPSHGYVSSWLITRVLDPQTNDEILFTYTSPTLEAEYETGLTQSLSMEVFKLLGNVSESVSYSFSLITLSEPVLSEVIFPDNSKLQLEYLFNRDDLKNSKGLTTVRALNYRNEVVKKVELNYSYFSSGSNFYKPNWAISNNDFNKRLKLISIKDVSNDNNEFKETLYTYNNLYLNPRASFNQDFWGYNIDPMVNNISLVPRLKMEDYEISLLGYRQFYLGDANRFTDEEFVKAGVLEKIVYPTGGYTEFEYECNQAFSDFNYYLNNVTGNNINWPLSQFNTLKSLTFPDRNSDYVSFKFKAIENDPRPTPDPNGPQTCFEDGQDLMMFRIEIYSSDPNFTTVVINDVYGGLLFGIEKIVQLPLGENYTVKFFYDAGANCAYEFPFYVSMSTEYFIEKFDKPVGGLRIKKIKSNDGSSNVFETEYNYNDLNGKSSAELKFIPNYIYSRSTTDKSTNAPGEGHIPNYSYQISLTSQPNNTLHFFNGGPLVYKNVTEIHKDGSSIIREYDDVHYSATGGPTDRTPFVPLQFFNNMSGLLLNETIKDAADNIISLKENSYQKSFTDLLNNSKHRNFKTTIYASTDGVMNSPYNYDATYYMCFQYFYKISNLRLVQTEETLFSNSLELPTTISYQYNSKNYLSQQTTANSKGEDLILKYYYPFNAPNFSYSSSLLTKNMLKSPVIKQQFKVVGQVEEPLWEQKTNYTTFNSSMIMPSNVTTSILGETPVVEMSIDAYDSKGNIRQYTGKDGQIHSFIWGYNHTYPVAHVVGADYNSIKNLINELLLNNPASTDQQIITELNNFRNSLSNQNVQVTTYTYIPLVGIKTITDQNGKTATYEYDNFWRLKLVRDHNGNIISAQDYQYAQ